jgi:hypothetical protein
MIEEGIKSLPTFWSIRIRQIPTTAIKSVLGCYHRHAREMPTPTYGISPTDQMKGPTGNHKHELISDGHAAMGLHSGDTRAARKRSVFAIYPCQSFGFRASHPVR